MTNIERRTFLRFLTAASLLPTPLLSPAAASESAGLIAPPAGTMRFRRQFTRNAGARAQVVVSREFDVRFTRFRDGFLVEGEQVSASVEAPPSLSAFADLEQARIESGLFPVTLDPFGLIRAENPAPARHGETEQALAVAREHIADQPIGTAERVELQRFVAAMQQAGNGFTANWPVDLFAPSEAERSEDRAIELPTGDVGRMISRFGAERDSQTGLMRRAMREVVTEIDGEQRRTIEQWHLSEKDVAEA